jgi:gliding motility-associated-like protein
MTVTACDSFAWEGQVLRQGGYYTYTGRTQDNCDSTVVLDLMLNVSTSQIIEATTCASFTWKGQEYDQSGRYTFDTLNAKGCDSTVTLDLTIRDTIYTGEEVNICTGDTILVFGLEVYEARRLDSTFLTPEGCDSTHTVEVVVDEVYRGDRTVSFCEGDSVFVIDRWIKEAGQYEVTKTNESDCDSVISVLAMELMKQTTFDTVSLCEGDTLTLFGQEVTTAMDVDRTFTGMNGCDSTAHIRVNLLQEYTEQIDFTLCPQDSVFIGGRWINGEERITQDLMARNGCDSTIVIDIRQVPMPDSPEYMLMCEEGEVEVGIMAEDIWDITWDNGSEEAMTTYPPGERATVRLTAPPNCEIEYTIDLPDLPALPQVPNLDDTLMIPGSTLEIDLGLDRNEWKVEWWPKEVVDCDTCQRVRIISGEDVEVRLRYTHTSGCVIDEAFWVRYAEDDIFIPNVFTPNGDNLNDVWQVFHTDNIVVERVWIFDRWGELIFDSAESGALGWDGRFQGEEVDPGVYTYMVTYRRIGQEDVERAAGDVTVVR